jgi:hypothetical protein
MQTTSTQRHVQELSSDDQVMLNISEGFAVRKKRLYSRHIYTRGFTTAISTACGMQANVYTVKQTPQGLTITKILIKPACILNSVCGFRPTSRSNWSAL